MAFDRLLNIFSSHSFTKKAIGNQDSLKFLVLFNPVLVEFYMIKNRKFFNQIFIKKIKENL